MNLCFGGGARRCVEAWFEMKLVLATILSRYQLALAEQKPVTTAPRRNPWSCRWRKMVIIGASAARTTH